METTATPEPPSRLVHTLIKDCLYTTPPADVASALRVEGVVLRFGFDPAAVERNRARIDALIDAVVPDQFYEGMSFLQLCEDRSGEQWGAQRDMDALLCLGIAVKRAKILLPRGLWSALPGGVPYVQFFKTAQAGG